MGRLFRIVRKIIFHPTEGLSELITEKPILTSVLFFFTTNLIFMLIRFSIYILVGGYSIHSFLFNKTLIIDVFSTFVIPFYVIIMVHLLCRYVYKCENEISTFFTCYLFITTVVTLVIGIANMGFYSLFFLTRLSSLFSPYNFIAQLIQLGWTLLLTIAAIVAIYKLKGKQAFLVWLIHFLPILFISSFLIK